MAITEEQVYVCDFCGDDNGLFNPETGNHRPCEELSELKVFTARVVKEAHDACSSEYMNCPWCSGRVGYEDEWHDEGCIWNTYKDSPQ